MIIVVVYLAIHFAVHCGWLIRYLHWVGYLRPGSARLNAIVDATARRMGAKVRATWEMAGVHAQAYAVVTTNELLFSQRLLECCTDPELESICVHELAHLTESKLALAGRLIGTLALFPLLFLTPLIEAMGVSGLAVAGLLVLGTSLLSQKLSRKLEQLADAAATARQADEGIYARALEKLYQINQVPAVNATNSRTHPHLYDRMCAAGSTPDYPRPRRPRRLSLITYGYALACLSLWVWTTTRDSSG